MASRQQGRSAKPYRRPSAVSHPQKEARGASPRTKPEQENRSAGRLRSVLRNNGLSIALLSCFLFFLAAESVTGHLQYNEEQREHGSEAIAFGEYLHSSHFVSVTMENWESEFLQMFAYVLMTVFLFQKGSSESKDPEKEEEEVDRDPRDARDKPGVPAPVRRGGFVLRVYESSLALALLVFFLLSFLLHLRASFAEQVEEQLAHGVTPVTFAQYVNGSRFWFESFQNWQSEFLAIAAMVLLSIFLRQRGSPESKPVDAPHSATGSG